MVKEGLYNKRWYKNKARWKYRKQKNKVVIKCCMKKLV